MAAHEHDLVVIGSGPGGYVAAIRAAQLGFNVACVERETALGGTCLRIGCIPSKALLESSEWFEQAKTKTAEHGVRLTGVELDLSTMMRRKEKVVLTLTKGVESVFKKHKIVHYLGQGRLNGLGQVTVEAPNGPSELKARHIVIATGSKSTALPGVQVEGALIGSSTEALSYDKVPAHLVVIGAGYIG